MNTKIFLIATIGLCHAPSSESKVGSVTQAPASPAAAEHTTLPIGDLINAFKQYWSTSTLSEAEERTARERIVKEKAIQINRQFPVEDGDEVLNEAVNALTEELAKIFDDLAVMLGHWSDIYELAPIIPLAAFQVRQNMKAHNITKYNNLFYGESLIKIAKIAANKKSNISANNTEIINIGEKALKEILEETRYNPFIAINIHQRHKGNLYLEITKIAQKLRKPELAIQAIQRAKSFAVSHEGEKERANINEIAKQMGIDLTSYA